MRGVYYTSGEDRRRFFHALNEMCKEEVFEIDLISSQLCLRDCLELLDELEYVYSDWDVDGGEGEIWVTCYCNEMPYITVLSDGYLGRLKIYWSDETTNADREKLKELMRKHWGKYFPVI